MVIKRTELKTLADFQKMIATLQREAAHLRAKELAELPAKYGFKSAKEFIKAIRVAAAGRNGSSPHRLLKKPGSKRRRRYFKISPEIKLKIVDALNKGKTGPQVAEELDVSLSSVYLAKRGISLPPARKLKKK